MCIYVCCVHIAYSIGIFFRFYFARVSKLLLLNAWNLSIYFCPEFSVNHIARSRGNVPPLLATCERILISMSVCCCSIVYVLCSFIRKCVCDVIIMSLVVVKGEGEEWVGGEIHFTLFQDITFRVLFARMTGKRYLFRTVDLKYTLYEKINKYKDKPIN